MMTTRERSAFQKAIKTNGAARVTRVSFGIYTLASATEAGVVHTVTGTSIFASDLTCSCEAAQRGNPCWHRAAVQLRRTQETAKAEARRLASAQPALAPIISLPGERIRRALEGGLAA